MDDTIQRRTLRELLVKHFNQSELKELCFDLGVDYEELSGNKSSKVIDLISYCERKGQTGVLIRMCFTMRPHVAWPFSWFVDDSEQESKHSRHIKLFGLYYGEGDPKLIYSEAIQFWLLGDLGRALDLCREVQRRDPYMPGIDITVMAIERELRKGYVDIYGEVLPDEVMRLFSEGRQAYLSQNQPLLAVFFLPQFIKAIKLSLVATIVVTGVAVGIYFGIYVPENADITPTSTPTPILTATLAPTLTATPVLLPEPELLTTDTPVPGIIIFPAPRLATYTGCQNNIQEFERFDTIEFRWTWSQQIDSEEGYYLEVRIGPRGSTTLPGRVALNNDALFDPTQNLWRVSIPVSYFYQDTANNYEWQVAYVNPKGQLVSASGRGCVNIR